MDLPVSRRNFIRLGATGAAAGMLSWTGHAQQPTPAGVPAAATRSRSGAEFLNADAQAAIDRGLDYIARNQLSDGSFSDLDRRDPIGAASVGITSLASLALMA